MGHNPNLKPYPRDPQMSKKLLAEAGFPNGADIEIITPAGRYLGDKEVVEAISFQVKEAGFNMKVRLLEWGMFLKSFKEGNGYFIGDAYSDPQQMFYGTGDSKAFSWVGYQNDEWIKLYNEASETFDVKKRGEIYEKMGRIEWDDPPALWLYHTQEIYGLRTRLKNFTPRADAFILLRGAYVE
jgi:peptide/nickel transport system substrate-binding protein